MNLIKKRGIICFLIVLISIVFSSYVFALTYEETEACKSVDNCNAYCCAQYGSGGESQCYTNGIGGNFYGNIISQSAYSNYNELGSIECGNTGSYNDNCICFSCYNGGQDGPLFYSEGALCCGVNGYLSDYSSCCPGYEGVTATEPTELGTPPNTYWVYEKVCCPAETSYVGAWPNGKCIGEIPNINGVYTTEGACINGQSITLKCDVANADSTADVRIWAGECTANNCKDTRSWFSGSGVVYHNNIKMEHDSGTTFKKTITISQPAGTQIAATCAVYTDGTLVSNWGDAYPLCTVTAVTAPVITPQQSCKDPFLCDCGSLSQVFAPNLIYNPGFELE